MTALFMKQLSMQKTLLTTAALCLFLAVPTTSASAKKDTDTVSLVINGSWVCSDGLCFKWKSTVWGQASRQTSKLQIRSGKNCVGEYVLNGSSPVSVHRNGDISIIDPDGKTVTFTIRKRILIAGEFISLQEGSCK
jgi:hypothetical protein